MRLLKRSENGSFEFVWKEDDRLPPYAILSHTWSVVPGAEVSYKDMMQGTAEQKESFAKIKFVAEESRKRNIEYFWADNCCINKENEAELAAALRSMYRWYENSDWCFVYLSDVSMNKRDHDGNPTWEGSFQGCRWFRRGWTLQELIAPTKMEFFARDRHLGSRNQLSEQIHEVTGISTKVLKGETSLNDISIDTRSRWKHGRETGVPEDIAYCMMGLYGVVFTPMYGEGRASAVKRLEYEVRKTQAGFHFEQSTGSRDKIPEAPEGREARLAQRKAKLELLYFDIMDSHRETIKRASGKTCNWILNDSTYLAWLNAEEARPHHGFLWIKGNPGAGKSVLVKHIEAHTQRKKSPGDICISFYFKARGESLEKSLEGMYRSLLLQLLQAKEDLQAILDDSGPLASTFKVTLPNLRQLLKRAVCELGNHRLFCFIDALDECEENDMQDLIEYFRDMCENATKNDVFVRICFASRYYPALDIPTGLQLELDHLEQHEHDLQDYVKGQKFQFGKDKGPKHIPAQIQEEILTKANGIFLWVVLVVEILKKEYINGRLHAVKQRLRDIPPKLSELFRDIVQRDRENINEFLLCLQWILYAKRPLNLKEFYFAMMAATEDSPLEWTPEIIDDYMLNFLRSSSKGLVEITKGKDARAQFIHESVRDFLLKQQGFEQIVSDRDCSPPVCHEVLKRCCHRALGMDEQQYWDTISSAFPEDSQWRPLDQSESDTLRQKYPFLEYAVDSIFYHSDLAASRIPQWESLQQLDIERWRMKANFFVRHEINLYLDSDLAYVFAERDHVNLLKLLAEHAVNLEGPSKNRYRYPLIAAFVNKHRNVARFLLAQQGYSDPDQAALVVLDKCRTRKDFDVGSGIIWLWAGQHGFKDLAMHFLRRDPDPPTICDPKRAARVLRTASSFEFPDLAISLLERGIGKDDPYLPMLAAAKHGRLETFKLLFEHLDSTKQRSRFWEQRALLEACEFGHLEIVNWFMEHGADMNVDGEDPGQRRALCAASRKGHAEVVKVLIQHGADLTPSILDQYALEVAAGEGHTEIVRLLIECGADVNGKSRNQSALHSASLRGHLDIVKVLLEHGAYMSDDPSDLLAAAINGHVKIVKLLVEHVTQVDGGNDATDMLHQAIVKAYPGVAKVLIAELAARGTPGCDYLRGAIENGRAQFAEQSIEHGTGDGAEEGKFLRESLHWAIYGNHSEVVKALIARGVPLNAAGPSEDTALWAAIISDHMDMVKLLIDAGADLNGPSGADGGPLLQCAVQRKCDTSVLQRLIEYGADVNARGGPYGSALIAASCAGSIDAIKLLLDNGADLYADGSEWGTALQAASRQGKVEAVKLLVETYGADVNRQGGKYGTALQAAASGFHNHDMVALLLSYGAEVHAKGGFSGSAIKAAKRVGAHEVVDLLMKHGIQETAVGAEATNGHTRDV